MTNLIEISNGEQVVNARTLHEYLQIQTPFRKWIKRRIEEFEFSENEDYVTTDKFVRGATQTDYAVTLDMAKELAMIEKTDKGREARKYFINAEKELQVKKENQARQLAVAAQENPNYLWDMREASLNKQLASRKSQVREIEDELKLVKSAPRQCPYCGKLVKGRVGLKAHLQFCEAYKRSVAKQQPALAKA